MTDVDAPPSPAEDAASAQQLVRSSALVALGTLTSRVTGLLRVVVLAYAIGGVAFAAKYNLANTTPNIVYELLLGGVLSATLVPLFVEHARRKDDRATDAIFTVTMTLLVVVSGLAVVFAPQIARLYTFRSSSGDLRVQRDVTTTLIRLFMPQIAFYGFTALATAALNARRRFVAAAFAPTLNNVVVMGVLLLFARVATGSDKSWTTVEYFHRHTGLLFLLGLGTTAGIVAMALVLVPPMIRAGVPFAPRFEWRHPAVRRMVRLSGWTVGYVIANQVAVSLVLVLASARSRDPNAYLYAYMFFQLPHGLLAVSLMTTVTPELARAASAGDDADLRAQFGQGLRYLIVVVLPAAAAFVVLAQPIAGVLVRGNFSAIDARLTGDTLQMFALGLLPFSVYLYALRGFYSLQDTRTPFVVNCFENVLNIAFALALYPHFGVQGLALAFSGAYAISAIGALALFHRRVGRESRVKRLQTRAISVRSAIASGVLAIVAAPIAGAIGAENAIHAATAATAAATAGGLAYLAALRILGVSEIATILGLLRPRRRTSGPRV
ncbi:MAG: murein biosynthesis integral rane protein MurJ [Actinomycetia bacterium]|nr:murein biosynthesis integral rane protein MurJ [Actinomycetes bacterium]